MTEAVIFDLDGVLVDTARYHFMAWKRLAAELGVTLTEAMNEKLKGVGRMESLNLILHYASVTLTEEEKIILTEKKNRWFNEYISVMKEDELFDGVRPLFHTLRQAGIKIGLASSSKNAGVVLKQLNIENEFDAIVDGNMITNSKPHPEIFLTAASKLGVLPRHCIVVEDAEAGVQAARCAGMKVIGVGLSAALQQADAVVKHIRELRPADVQKFLSE